MFDFHSDMWDASRLAFIKELFLKEPPQITPQEMRAALFIERWRFLIDWVEQKGGQWNIATDGSFVFHGFAYGAKECEAITNFLEVIAGVNFIPHTTPCAIAYPAMERKP